jgi:tetratricopeptide (TPR) repeat protein
MIAAQNLQSVDQENPWPGLSTFTEEQSAFFFGRDEEVRELLRRVERKLLTVLFGQSGLGKSSLLQAGVFPRLRTEGYCPIYVRLDHSPTAPPLTEQIKTLVYRETARAGTWTHGGAAAKGETLWEFFHHRDDQLRDADGNVITPVLVFDQFEELFTLGAAADPETRRRATGFIAELADFVENRPPANVEARMEASTTEVESFDFARADYRVLITLREDYLPHLESLKSSMPSIMQNRMRLTRMHAARAMEAVMKPGEGLVTAEVAEQIVAFVSGGSQIDGAEVEPSLLSLVCRELNNQRRARSEPVISTGLLAGTRDTILREFYERTLADQPPAVWHFVEDELLTDSGYRENIALERARKYLADAGASPNAIDVLVNRRLLRIEERLDVRRVELTHDVLCSVVKASRDVRHEREALEKTQRLLEEQKAREAATRQALNRARKIAAVCAVLMSLAIGNAIFGVLNLRRARAAETQAEETQFLAQRARGEAEKLVGFLLEDFYEELEPTGRLDTVSRLAQKAVGYYDGLPKELLSPETRRYQAMALVRQGAAMVSHGDLNAAVPVLAKAKAIFNQLLAEGDKSEETTIGLALALYAHSPNGIMDTGALVDLQRSADLLRPRATSAGASRRVRRLYADVLNFLSTNQSRENAVATCEEARTILVGLGALDLSDLSAASAYGDVADSEARQAFALGRIDDAEKLENDALNLAEKVLAQRPGDLRAMLNRCYAPDMLARIAMRRSDYTSALTFAAKADQSAEDYVRFNPSNAAGWQLWVSARARMAKLMLTQGRITDGLAQARAAAALEHDPRNSSGITDPLFSVWSMIASTEAQLGHRAAADTALEEYGRIAGAFPKQARLSPIATSLMLESVRALEAHVRVMFGEDEPVLASSKEAVDRIEKLTTNDKNTAEFKARVYRTALENTVRAAIHLKRGPEAEVASKILFEDPLKDLPSDEAAEAAAWYRVLHARAVLLQGRRSDVAAIVDPATKYYREQQGKQPSNVGFLQKVARALGGTNDKGKNTFSLTVQQRLARSLCLQAAALADDSTNRGTRRATLDEAGKLLESLPDETKPLRDSREAVDLIAEVKRG